MFYEADRIRVNADIIAVAVYSDRIFLVSNRYELYMIDFEYKLKKKLVLLKDKEPLHTFSHAISLSERSYELLLPFEMKPLALLVGIKEGLELKSRIDVPLKTVECTAFSPQGNYFAIGDASGRVNIFDRQSANYVTSLKPRPDYINVLEFSENERFILSAAFDKSVIIFDLALNIEIATFMSSDVVESACFFGDQIALFMRNGAVCYYDLREKKLGSEQNLFVSWPTTALVLEDQRHILVGMKNGSIAALDIASQKLVFTHKCTTQGITKLKMLHKELLVFAKETHALVIDTEYKLKAFEEALATKMYDEVSALLGENLFLMLHPDYDAQMQEFYNPIFEQLYTLIEEGDEAGAQAIQAQYKDDPKVCDYFNLLINAQEYIKQLAQYIDKKAYIDAYALIEKYHYLKDSNAAARLERLWLSAFNQAKQLGQKNDATSIKRAQELLAPFAKVPCKQQTVYNLIKNIAVYTKADELIKAKKIPAYLALVEKHPFLKEQDTYKKVLAMGESYMEYFKAATLKNDFNKAKEYLHFLRGFCELKKELDVIKQELVLRMHFFSAIQKNELMTVYKMAKEHPELRTISEYKKIEKNFNYMMKEALDIAFSGDAKALKLYFRPYMDIPLFEEKIAAMLKIAYLNEMKKAKEQALDWEAVFCRFMKLFGKSDELLHTAKILKQHALLEALECENNSEGFYKYELPDTIISD